MKKILPLLAIVLIAGATYFLFFAEKPSTDMHQAKSDLTLSAIELYADFRQDEAAANEKFLNKTLVVQGEVIDVSAGKNGMPQLKLYSKGTSFGVKCLMDKESQQKRMEYHLGEIVKLKCICMDYYNDVELTNCVEVE
ncbi:MAG: hypothetical protein AAFZ15_04640 [Bacteroidota bacterium]